MPNSVSAVPAASITGQSESDPITMPTSAVARPFSSSPSLTLVSQLPGEPRGRVPRALQTIRQVITVGVDVADLAARPQVLPVQVHAQPRVAGERVRVPVVQPAGLDRAAEHVDHH